MADQPGLEVVVPPEQRTTSQFRSVSQNLRTSLDTFPEVVPFELLNHRSLKPEAIPPFEEEGNGSISGPSGERNNGLTTLTPKFLTGPYGRRILIGIGILIVAVVAAVVGGVIGSRRSNSVSSTPTSGSTTPPPPPPTSTLTVSRPLQSNSGLAAAGWRTQGGFFNLRVFYQDEGDGLRFSEYKSDGSGWGNSTKVDRRDVLSNTTLGATAILDMSPPQYELFFQNTSYLVTGNNFRDGISPQGGLFDSIDERPILAHSKSRLTTYWPYVALQKPNLTLHVINWIGEVGNPWQNQSLGITALEGTSLAILPQSASYGYPYRAALIYRGPNGLLALHSLDNPWPFTASNQQGFLVTIGGAQSSSFGVFAVARKNDPNNATNIYILYQTASNDLEYVYYHGDSWKLGPASDALMNADASTDITCLSESIWFGKAVMSAKYDMSRCYFFSEGRIKESPEKSGTLIALNDLRDRRSMRLPIPRRVADMANVRLCYLDPHGPFCFTGPSSLPDPDDIACIEEEDVVAV
ncbi:hypothetical protein NUW58_g9557 [Xylaria curta]|uniref:Uncharacterized protein n=1 Tax=Xylaria curta TaxID=42375 RepID=A0ACC1MXE4_9PEZI|nr:hypothetical protein NUW58_g9557 [Xylaria curta]